MNPLPAVKSLAEVREKVDKQTFQSSYYAEKKGEFEKARAEFTENPDSIIEYLTAEIAFDTTQLQYNETGAFIAANNQGLMSETFLGEKDLTIDNQTGAVIIDESDKNQVLYGFTLPSLAIINSKEGHEGGNRALKQVTKIIERSGSTNISPAVFHNAGADFRAGVTVRMPGDAEQFETDVLNSHWSPVEGTEEVPFLVLEKVTLKESLQSFNRLQTLRSIFSPEQVLTNEEDIEREILKISNDILTYRVEYSRGREMCARFWDKYSKAEGQNNEYYENYFNAYLKSYFQPIGINTLEEMKTLASVNSNAAFDEVSWRRAEASINQEDIIREAAIKNLVESKKPDYFNGREYSEKRETLEALSAFDFDIAALENLARQRNNRFEFEKKSDEQTHLNLRTPIESDTQAYKEFYEAWQLTQRLLKKMQVTQALNQNDLDTLVELAGLNEEIIIGESSYLIAEELSNAVFKNATPQKFEALDKLIKDRYENLYMKIDGLTGVPNRESFYRETSEFVYRHLFEGKKTTLGFIDLAFLSYFNKGAGRKTGDRAIIQSISQLEELRLDVAEKTGSVIDISRYAGDEEILRGINVDKEIAEAIEKLNAQERTVPLQDPSALNYIPAPIQYNYGIANIYMAEDCMESILEAETENTSPFADKDSQIFSQILEARKPYKVIDTVFNFDAERYSQDPLYAKTLKQNFSEFASLIADRVPGNAITELIRRMESSNAWDNILEIETAFNTMQPIITNELMTEVSSLIYERLIGLPQESVNRYAEKLTRVMILVADAFVDIQKAQSRFDFLYRKYAALTPEDLSQQTVDGYMLLQSLITFSGKSLRGLSITALTEVKDMYERNPSKTPWEYYLTMIGENNKSEADPNQPKNIRSQIIAKIAGRD